MCPIKWFTQLKQRICRGVERRCRLHFEWLWVNFMLLSVALHPNPKLGDLFVRVRRSHDIGHTHTHTHTRARRNTQKQIHRHRHTGFHSIETVTSLSQRSLPTQHTTNSMYLLLSVLQTRYPRNEIAADVQLRTQSQQVRRSHIAFC